MPLLKSILVNMLTGATAASAVALVLVAYSDRLHPVNHPLLACAGMFFPIVLAANVVLLVLWLLMHWKRAWIPLAGIVLSYPAVRVYVPLHLAGEPPEGSIKVVSYNVAGYGHTSAEGHALDSVMAYLRRQQADIVCLQEDASGQYRCVDSLARLFPYNDTVHVNSPANPMINAVGLHSRFPIVGRERIGYPSFANGSVAFFLLVDGDTVIVINNHLETTHLSATDRQHYTDIINGDMNTTDARAETRTLLSKLSSSMAKRAPQAEAVHRYVEQHTDHPLILCGDFNDSPISYARHTVAQGLTDCYVESGNGLGISFNRKGFYFRIDQLMCSRHFEPYGCMVDNSIDASDHYPVVCWLKRVP